MGGIYLDTLGGAVEKENADPLGGETVSSPPLTLKKAPPVRRWSTVTKISESKSVQVSFPPPVPFQLLVLMLPAPFPPCTLPRHHQLYLGTTSVFRTNVSHYGAR